MKFTTWANSVVLVLLANLVVSVSSLHPMQGESDARAVQYTVNFMWVGKRLAVSPVFLHSSKRSGARQFVCVENLFSVLHEWASSEGSLSINLWYDGALLEDDSDLVALRMMIALHQERHCQPIRLLDVRSIPFVRNDEHDICGALSKLFTPISQNDPFLLRSCAQQLRCFKRKAQKDEVKPELIASVIANDISKNRRYFGVDLIRAIMTHAAASDALGAGFGDCFVYSDLDIARPLSRAEMFDAETAGHIARWPLVMMRHGEQDCGLQNPLLGDMNFYENGFQIVRTRDTVCAGLTLEQIILPAVQDVYDPEVFNEIWGGGIWHRYAALFTRLESLLPPSLRRKNSDWQLHVPTKYMPFIEPSDYHINPEK